jgi:hypothetical protein
MFRGGRVSTGRRQIETVGGAWMGVEGRGGAWRGVEGRGGAWRVFAGDKVKYMTVGSLAAS